MEQSRSLSSCLIARPALPGQFSVRFCYYFYITCENNNRAEGCGRRRSGSAERTNKHAGERQLDKHKCESADCEGFLFRMMMSCVWEEEVKDNSIAHPSHTCLQYSYGLLPSPLSLSLSRSHSVFPLATSSYAIARALICVCAGKTMEQGSWICGTGCRPGSGPCFMCWQVFVAVSLLLSFG